jgi:type II secretory pathway component PulF
MKTYAYRAADSTGAVRTGRLRARDVPGADLILMQQGLTPLRLREVLGEAGRQPLSSRQTALMLRSLATLIEAGVPLSAAVSATAELKLQASLDKVLRAVQAMLDEGATLVVALSSCCRLPLVAEGLIRAGEESGRLHFGLDLAAAHLEQEVEFQSRLVKALMYPAVLLLAGLVSASFIALVVVPRFSVLLADAGQQVPVSTHLLLSAAGVVRQYWAVGLTVFAVLLGAGLRWCRVGDNRALVHGWLLKLPFIGRVRQAWATARLAGAMGVMVESGMPILKAMETAGHGLSDACLKQRLNRAVLRVANGAPLGPSLAAEAALLPSVAPLVALGDSTGRLSDMLIRAGKSARAEAERLVDGAVTLIEPALVLFFGCLVGLLATALLQAVYSLRPGL